MLKYSYETETEIPEKFRDLYAEQNGVFVLSNIEGAPTPEDIAKLTHALRQERREHAESKRRMQDLNKNVAEIDVEAEAALKVTPSQREREKLMKQVQEAQEKINYYEKRDKQRSIRDTVLDAARRNKIVDTALDDVALLAERIFDVAEDGNVLSKDGLLAEEWIGDMKTKKPHWWAQSYGGGAMGSGIHDFRGHKNPFSGKNWNMTEQMVLINQNRELAEKLAAEAGTSIGGMKPVA